MCEWFNCDNQGRGGDETPIWGCALQGRVCNAVQKGKTAPTSPARGPPAPRWRNVAKSPRGSRDVDGRDAGQRHGALVSLHRRRERASARIAAGWSPAASTSTGWRNTTPHFVNKRSIANLGVVMGQRTHLFYTPPRRRARCSSTWTGMYYALLEGRFLFDFVHEDNLAPEKLRKYSALRAAQHRAAERRAVPAVARVRRAGGSLLATFETSLYNERNERRADFGLADVFGIHKAGEHHGHHRQRVSMRASKGRTQSSTALQARIGCRAPSIACRVRPGRDPGADRGSRLRRAIRRSCPIPRQSRTNEPAVVVREKGKSRLVYFPGDIDRTMWQIGPYRSRPAAAERDSLGRARQIARDASKETGVVETFAWETQAGFAVHVLNYTNPAMHRGWIRDFYPIGPQKVSFDLPREGR